MMTKADQNDRKITLYLRIYLNIINHTDGEKVFICFLKHVGYTQSVTSEADHNDSLITMTVV